MVGTSVLQYRIIRQLGSGGMGIVYEAEDTKLNRKVALKFLPESLVMSSEAADRFGREAKLAGSLNHPNICTVHESGLYEGRQFFVMELLEGDSLKTLIQDKPLPIDQILDVGCQIADALEVAHTKGIVHRDIKPANIMILPSGDPKIMDFGVAKLDSSKLTSAGDVLGSPGYMAPEQALEARVDPRSDIFSLGTVLYEALTGKRAFGKGTFSEILMRLAYEQPTPPSRINGDIPEAVDDIVARAMAKNPDQRYANADQMVEDIEDALFDRPLRHAASGDAPTAAAPC